MDEEEQLHSPPSLASIGLKLRSDRVTRLDFSHCRLGIGYVTTLSDALAENSTLSFLACWGCDLGGFGFMRIVKGLEKSHCPLQHLDVGLNSIEDFAAVDFANSLMLGRLSYLRVLILSKNLIGQKGGEALGRVLVTDQTIEKIDISDNRVGDKGAFAFASAISQNRTLKGLNLSKNVITDVGATSLCTALARNHVLQHLNLTLNKIRDQGICHQFDVLLSRNKSELHHSGYSPTKGEYSIHKELAHTPSPSRWKHMTTRRSPGYSPVRHSPLKQSSSVTRKSPYVTHSSREVTMSKSGLKVEELDEKQSPLAGATTQPQKLSTIADAIAHYETVLEKQREEHDLRLRQLRREMEERGQVTKEEYVKLIRKTQEDVRSTEAERDSLMKSQMEDEVRIATDNYLRSLEAQDVRSRKKLQELEELQNVVLEQTKKEREDLEMDITKRIELYKSQIQRFEEELNDARSRSSGVQSIRTEEVEDLAASYREERNELEARLQARCSELVEREKKDREEAEKERDMVEKEYEKCKREYEMETVDYEDQIEKLTKESTNNVNDLERHIKALEDQLAESEGRATELEEHSEVQAVKISTFEREVESLETRNNALSKELEDIPVLRSRLSEMEEKLRVDNDESLVIRRDSLVVQQRAEKAEEMVERWRHQLGALLQDARKRLEEIRVSPEWEQWCDGEKIPREEPSFAESVILSPTSAAMEDEVRQIRHLFRETLEDYQQERETFFDYQKRHADDVKAERLKGKIEEALADKSAVQQRLQHLLSHSEDQEVEIKKLRDRVDDVSNENASLRDELLDAQNQNSKLKAEISILKSREEGLAHTDEWTEKIGHEREEARVLRKEKGQLEAKLEALQNENETLKKILEDNGGE